MAKITDYKNPVTGQKGNIFNVKDIWSQVLGVVVIFFVYSLGRQTSNFIEGKSGGKINANPLNDNKVVNTTRTF